MNFFDQSLFSFDGVGKLAPNRAISHWPIENAVFERVSIFGNVNYFELVLETSNVDSLC